MSITNSWKKDKVALDLLHLYHVFDWDNNEMIISSH
jgi:hypothetical protein